MFTSYFRDSKLHLLAALFVALIALVIACPSVTARAKDDRSSKTEEKSASDSKREERRQAEPAQNRREQVREERRQPEPVREERRQAQPVREERRQTQPVREERRQTQPVAEERRQTQPVREERRQTQPVVEDRRTTNPTPAGQSNRYERPSNDVSNKTYTNTNRRPQIERGGTTIPNTSITSKRDSVRNERSGGKIYDSRGKERPSPSVNDNNSRRDDRNSGGVKVAPNIGNTRRERPAGPVVRDQTPSRPSDRSDGRGTPRIGDSRQRGNLASYRGLADVKSWNRNRDRNSGSYSNNTDTARQFQRTYQRRHDWHKEYRNYSFNWRPRHQNGFFFYAGPVFADPYYYGHYCFAYVPRSVFPSIYFLYGTFPYIYRERVVVINRPTTHYVYDSIDLYDDDYYLSPSYRTSNGYTLSSSARRSLRDSLDNVEVAWETGDSDLLLRYASESGKLDVFFKGDYSYTINYEDYSGMTRDAMQTLGTIEFKFDDIKMRRTDEAVAYGYHTYYDSDDDYQKIYVSYTLRRMGSQWYITEVGSSPDPLDD